MSDDNHVDWVNAVAAAIRKADGSHTMGAAALAEVAVDALYPLVQAREMEFWAVELQKMARLAEQARESEAGLREKLAYWIEERAAAHPAYSPEKRVLVECAIWIKTGHWES
jgi:hypothetical protein